MGSKIHVKSMKNRGCVADAFLERFGCVLGAFRDGSGTRFGHPLATIFGQESKKRKKLSPA